MICSLNGILQEKSPTEMALDVGGVGYRVFISMQSYARLPRAGEKVSCLIHTSVREDDISLFGFLDEREKRLFQKLLTVSGIGPKLALTVLSGIPHQELVLALRREDLIRLMAIPGIGRKTAERMIVELKDKMAGMDGTSAERLPEGPREEILSALLNLGYPRPTAERTVARLSFKNNAPLENLVKEALKMLAENRL